MYFLPPYRRGIFNRYRKGMPVTEMLLKDLDMLVRNLVAVITTGKKLPRFLVHPHFPSRGGTIFRIAKALGYEVTNKISRGAEVAIYWEYATVREEFEALERLASTGKQVINLNHRDISKDVVDEQMLEAFGYCTKIDPLTYKGKAVRKSNTNAVHDGTLVECPCAPEEGYIYQKFIDSSVNPNEVMDLRIPIMGNEIPHLYLNYRNNGERFKNVPDRAVLCTQITDQLSREEIEQILRFAAVSQMDFGELDVLRDCHDHRLYVVDANNTPQGPPKNLTPAEKQVAIASYADCFKRQFIQRPPQA
jgi:hypothetical protein